MSIRLRTTLTIAVAAALCLTLLFLLSRFLLLPEFEEIENAEMLDYTRQVLSEFDEKYEQVINSLQGDANWDDTQAYLRGEYPEYPEVNTTPDYVAALKLNFMAFADLDGELLSYMAVDIAEEREVPVPPGLLDAVAPLTDIGLYPETDSAQMGTLDIDGELWLVAAIPALSSERRGPPAGTVIGALTIDEEQRTDLVDSGLVTFDLFPLSQSVPDELEDAWRDVMNGGIHVHAHSSDLLAGYALVWTPQGEPSAFLQVSAGRDRLQNAYRTVNFFITAVIIGGFLVAVVVLKMLDHILITRINAIKRWMDEHHAAAAPTERVTMNGNDEISSLAHSFNRLLDGLARAQGETERARDEALAALEFKQQLLANISHDARTPLSVIMLRTENITRGMYGAITDRQRKVLEGVRASANQMLFFVNNLLSGAKLQSGGLLIHPSPFQVISFAEEVRTMMEPLAADQGLTLDVTVDPLLPPLLMGDSDRLKQIVFNLVDNAIKFTSSGSVTVALKMNDGAIWSIQVSDTGTGIPEDKLLAIFEAFYQVDNTSTRKANAGVGLGLSIVKQLVELMKGTVEVKSTVGVGTTFFVRLPLVPVGVPEAV